MRPVAKRKIAQYNNADYDVLRTYLFANIGAYCSYCEQPIANDSAVEHKAPKTQFALFATQWRNVLLACQTCNSTKGVTPSSADVPNHGGLSNEALYLATLALWVWPDSTPNSAVQPSPPVDESLRLFQFERSTRTQLSLAQAGLLRVNWGVNNAPAWALVPQQKTWVVPNDGYIGANAPLRARVVRTIAGLNLNLNNTADLGYNDRRVDNRDAAYTIAQSALTRLYTIYTGSGHIDAERVVVLVKAIREAALATGFWSLWFTLFRAALDNPAQHTPWFGRPVDDRRELLLRTLVYFFPDEQDGDDEVPLFPGTDETRLNLGAFQ